MFYFRMTSKQIKKVTAILAAYDPDLASDFVGYMLVPRPFIRVADFLGLPSHIIYHSEMIELMMALPPAQEREIRRIIFDK